MTWQILDQEYEQAKIAVIGIGGGGGNMVNHMINSGIRGVDFICANTDSQDLSKIQKAKLIKLGNDQTRGLGAGNDPLQGKLAAELSLDEIEDVLKILKWYLLQLEWVVEQEQVQPLLLQN